MEGEVVHGVLHGKVLIRGKANTLIFSGMMNIIMRITMTVVVLTITISGRCMMYDDEYNHDMRITMTMVVSTISISGRYMEGYPEGPAWIFSPTDSKGTDGALYVHFKNGHLVTEDVVVVLPGWEKAIVGRYTHIYTLIYYCWHVYSYIYLYILLWAGILRVGQLWRGTGSQSPSIGTRVAFARSNCQNTAKNKVYKIQSTGESAEIQKERRTRDLLSSEDFLCGRQGVGGKLKTSSFQQSCQGGKTELDFEKLRN